MNKRRNVNDTKIVKIKLTQNAGAINFSKTIACRKGYPQTQIIVRKNKTGIPAYDVKRFSLLHAQRVRR